MNATEIRFERVGRRLDVFEESWQANHATALLCRDFEDFLLDAVGLFRTIERALHRTRREDVFRGLEEANPALDEKEKWFFSRWLALTESLGEVFAHLEQEFGILAGTEEFCQCQQSARAILANWTPARIARAVGARVIDISTEGADQLQALLKQPPGGPGELKWSPKPVPLGNPAKLH